MSANDRQVGGNHYRGEYQHWDWVCDNYIHYLPAAASKYVARNRRKNGEEDLQKALHYIEKSRERKILPYRPFNKDSEAANNMANFWRFVVDAKLTIEEALACYYLQESEWEAAHAAVVTLLNKQAS